MSHGMKRMSTTLQLAKSNHATRAMDSQPLIFVQFKSHNKRLNVCPFYQNTADRSVMG